MLSTILIIDKRKELSLKYKRSIDEVETDTVIANNLKDALIFIQNLEPEMILISDSIEENLADFCKKIRALTFNFRPIIIALSKSADISDRINVLENGADDFISEPVNTDEFKTRIKAHLRREAESNLDNKTLLPNKKITNKILKRVLSSDNLGVLYVKIENLSTYKTYYTELAADKLIQTFIAIAKSALDETNFIGQIGESEFIIVINRYGLENFANFLTFAFDTVIPKFYSESDVERGYLILKGEKSAEMRGNFVSALIGGIADGFNMIPNPSILMNRLEETAKLAKKNKGSSYAIKRIQLTGHDSVFKTYQNKDIYIFEKDESLRYLIRTTLELQGYNVLDEIDKTDSVQPKIIIFDSGDNSENLEYLKELKSLDSFVHTKFIVTSTLHNKADILNCGADLYLPKPYEISELISYVEYFMVKM